MLQWCILREAAHRGFALRVVPDPSVDFASLPHGPSVRAQSLHHGPAVLARAPIIRLTVGPMHGEVIRPATRVGIHASHARPVKLPHGVRQMIT